MTRILTLFSTFMFTGPISVCMYVLANSRSVGYSFGRETEVSQSLTRICIYMSNFDPVTKYNIE
jgi:hypothetical protein